MLHSKAMQKPLTEQLWDGIVETFDMVRRYVHYMITALVLSFFMMVNFAQTATIDIDTDTFITSINQWLPMAITIAAIGVGIAGGFKLAQFIGRMIVNAFDGRL